MPVVGFYDEIVFSLLPASMWLFSFAQCRGVAQLVFGLSSEAVVSPVAINAVCLGGVSLGSFLYHPFETQPTDFI